MDTASVAGLSIASNSRLAAFRRASARVLTTFSIPYALGPTGRRAHEAGSSSGHAGGRIVHGFPRSRCDARLEPLDVGSDTCASQRRRKLTWSKTGYSRQIC